MNQTLLGFLSIAISGSILLGLIYFRRRGVVQDWSNWYVVLAGILLLIVLNTTRLIANLTLAASLSSFIDTIYDSGRTVGALLLIVGLMRKVAMITRLVEVDALLRQTLVEVDELPSDQHLSAIDLVAQVKHVIAKHQSLLLDLQASQATNEALIAAMPDMLFVLSPDGVLLNNLTPQHTNHYSPTNQYIGSRLQEILPAPLGERIAAYVKAAHTAKKMERFQHDVTLGKQTRHLEARFLPNDETTVLAIVRDVTHEARLTDKLMRSEKRYETLLQHSNDAIIVHTLGGEFTDANQRATELFGYSREVLLENGWKPLFGANADEQLHNAYETLREERYLLNETSLVTKDGTQFFANISSTLIEVDQTPLVICIVRDVTEQKRNQFVLEAANIQLELARNQLEDRVEQRTSALAQTNRDLETLLYVVSHDLKEPLRAIENFSLLVNRRYAQVLDPKGQDFLRRVVRASERMRKLINDILQLSRARRMAPAFENVSGHVLVSDVLERLETRIEELNASITVKSNLPDLHVNVTWATQAIYNLVGNALKYSQPDQPPIIEIDRYEGLEQPGLVVRDHGIGIPPEHAERIFELFQRAVGRDIEGTGAGLAIVREVANRHNGNVWVQPNPAGGSEFYITFGHPADAFEGVFA